jgi:RND family efflux transporter MFP subunit
MKTEDTNPRSDVEQAQTIAENPNSESVAPSSRTHKTKKPLWPFLVLMAMLVAGGLGWRAFTIVQNSSNQKKTETPAAEFKLPVRVVAAKTAPIQSWVFSDGYVSAAQYKHLTFEVPGTITYVKKINGRDLREGDVVRKGEVLARVDQRKLAADVTVAQAGRVEADNQVTTAMATLQQSLANFRQAEASLAQAQASLSRSQANQKKAESDRNLAASELKRYQDLRANQVISQSDLDVKQTQYQNAEAAVEAAKAEVSAAQGQVKAAMASVEAANSQVKATRTQVESAQSGVQSASAQLSKSAVNLEDTVIKAPFDGIIAHLNIKEGDYWTPQRVQPSAEYQRIVETVPMIVIDPSQFEVNVEFPSFQGTRIRPGQQALIILNEDLSTVSSGNLTNETLMKKASAKGTVFSVSPSVSPGARSVEVKIRISEGAANLRDGARVAAWIAVEEKGNATVAPFSAFVFRDQKPHVFVVNKEKGIVEQRQIQPGIEGISMREILQGVKPNELLVTEGKNRLVHEAPVEIIQ